ncbi:MAG: EsaB/YukD family protein [Defluviitaleaceae bacterium]|nr:EsaB/YukD family protein [Defluviitaleaceae bacterium]
MDYILVTLEYGDLSEDIKVPSFISVEELIKVLEEIYDIEGTALHAEPKGIILNKNKTLEEQGILHGARLTLSR